MKHPRPSDEELVKLHRRCIRFAMSRRSCQETAHDFAGWVVTKAIEGRSTTELKWLYADYWRALMGRTESPTSAIRQALHSPAVVDDCYATIAVERETPVASSRELMKMLHGKDAGLIAAVALGRLERDIGRDLGVSGSRISQRVSAARRRMKKIYQDEVPIPLELEGQDLVAWQGYVARARELVNQIHASRMEVAELAMKAVKIHCGGDRRSEDYFSELASRSLKHFASQIGVSYATLWDWIQVKRLVHDKVTLSENDYGISQPATSWNQRHAPVFDYTAAKRTAYAVKKDPTVDVNERYQVEKNRERVVFRFNRFLSHVRSLDKYLQRPKLPGVPKSEIREMSNLCRSIQEKLNAIDKRNR